MLLNLHGQGTFRRLMVPDHPPIALPDSGNIYGTWLQERTGLAYFASYTNVPPR